jgi:hypothetical protein
MLIFVVEREDWHLLPPLPPKPIKAIGGFSIMTELQKKAAVILAVADRIAHGSAAKPSGYWGVAPLSAAHALDAEIETLTTDALEGVLDRLTGGVN